MNRRILWLGLFLGLALGVPAGSTEWHVTPDGKESGDGGLESPWDLASALGGSRKVEPGDTIWIHEGRYHAAPRDPVMSMGFAVRLAGREGAPVRVRGVAGRRVTIDGGLNVQPPSTDLEIRDLEILVSEPRPDGPIPPDPSYRGVNRPWGGLNVYSGERCKFLNLVIHDNCQGVSWWAASRDSELYGCLIYDNGWAGTDRGHGHAIYTQNADGTKTVADCILTGGFGYTLHAYGSARADVDNYLAEGNIVHDSGPFLIGGGKPSHGIRVRRNLLFDASMQLGYTAPFNEDCEVRDNLIVNGGLTINRFRTVVNEDNLILARDAPRPGGTRVVFRPNRYDPLRAHLAVLSWDRASEAVVDTGNFLKAGESYRLLNPRDVFGTPVRTGTADGPTLRVPVAGEFAAFVLLKTGS
jgi:hypothetical protein